MYLSDILAALGVVLNGLPQGLLALTYGFAALPTSLAFIVGMVGALIFNNVAPISFQAETIVLAGSLGQNRLERLNIVFWCGVFMTVIGVLGILGMIIDFVGPVILNAMMAGVGIILAKVAVEMTLRNWQIGGLSVLVASLVFFGTGDLVYTIVSSVIVGTILNVLKQQHSSNEVLKNYEELEKFSRIKLCFNNRIIRGVLALITLQVGGNIAYGTITGNIANTPVNVDHLTIFSGLASSVSALFGGGPVESIISGTGTAPNPLIAAVLMMGIMAIILLSRLLPKIGKYVPSESIAGFLFILGAVIVFPVNIVMALEGNGALVGVTTIATATTDPFIGLVVGVVFRFIIVLLN